MTRICSVDSCTRPAAAQGFCHAHYRKFRYHGGQTIQQHGTYAGGSISLKGYARYGHDEVHRARAERALGKPLPPGAVVHHFNGDKENPDATLVICPNQKYHALLHRRQQALDASGNSGYIKCRYCNKWDDPVRGNMYITTSSTHHRACRNKGEREKRRVT